MRMHIKQTNVDTLRVLGEIWLDYIFEDKEMTLS